MRFDLQSTSDGSLTVFDREVGECFKSHHAARTEAEHVFFIPGVLENPCYGTATPFRVLELGLGLGTNILYFLEKGFQGEFLSIERDLAGAKFFLSHSQNGPLNNLVNLGNFQINGMRACLIQGDFTEKMLALRDEKYLAHAILFDPFSPKANPDSWTVEMFRLAFSLLTPGGRLVSYSVSRIAKDAATAAGFQIEKRKLPDLLNKRSALLATKPIH